MRLKIYSLNSTQHSLTMRLHALLVSTQTFRYCYEILTKIWPSLIGYKGEPHSNMYICTGGLKSVGHISLWQHISTLRYVLEHIYVYIKPLKPF